MRPFSPSPLLLSLMPLLGNCQVVLPASRPTDIPPATAAISHITPTLHISQVEASPEPTAGSLHENLDLRQAAADANPDAADAPPAADPDAPAEPILPPPSDSISLTVKWVETRLTFSSTTSTTWVPQTITIRFPGVMEQGAPPGKGEIGLGTLEEGPRRESLGPGATGSAGRGRGLEGVSRGVRVAGVVGGLVGFGLFGMG